jgi:hypothetical protein
MYKMKAWQIAGIVGGCAILGFGYYAISPLFRNIKVDEALPGGVQATSSKAVSVAQGHQAGSAPSPVIGTTGHPASGTARIVETDGTRFVRYENFKTINGPDLYIYLAKDLDAKEFVNLGTIRATEGNVNYEIPPGVDVAEYRYVLTWCKQFGVLFNYAAIAAL